LIDTAASFSVAASHQDKGLYEAQYVPQISGDYNVDVTLRSEHISGSPYQLFVRPGEIKASNSRTTILESEISQFEAGITYRFTI
jgi:hypothetical protein